jgi:hypothetical protein
VKPKRPLVSSRTADSDSPERSDEYLRQALEKVDRESTHHILQRWQKVLISLIALGFSCFHI